MKHLFLTCTVFLLFISSARADEVFDRVIKSGTLRCGYVVAEALEKDPNTGEISGIVVDIMTEAARLLDLKLVWAEELTWMTFPEVIKSGRIDAICTNFWMDPAGSKYVSYTVPFYFSGVGAYVRADDDRFSGNNLQALNHEDVRIAASDGEMASLIAGQDYPKAQLFSIPQIGNSSQQLLEVATGKADVTFVDTALGVRFSRNNPGKVKNIVPENPVRLFANTIALPPETPRLKTMLDTALLQMIYGGYVDKILDKYAEQSGGYYRVAKPYEVSK